jgi:hypothetical protein
MPDWQADVTTTRLLGCVSTGTLTTQPFKRGLRTRYMSHVTPVRPGSRMVGPARTLDLSERFVYGLVEEGASVFDVYPMDADTRERYRRWRDGLDDDAALDLLSDRTALRHG